MKKKRFYFFLTTILIVLQTLCGTIYAQSLQSKITFELKDQPLKAGLDQIGKLSGFRMAYSISSVSAYQHITLPKGERTVGATLDLLLSDTKLAYTINEDKILIINKPEEKNPPKTGGVTVSVNIQRDIQVTGIVMDMEMNPLTGVTVRLRNSNEAVFTDETGRFSLGIPQNSTNPVLIFSFIGMKTREVQYAGKNMEVILQNNVNELQDVIVTGIFTKQKNSYTGAVSVITDKELDMFKGRNIFTTLNNIDPSFNIIQNNNLGADPNRLPEIQIRGAGNLPDINQLQDQSSTALNTPLIILNGFEISLQRMMDLNQQEISSISILKDGSATALYGSRGANGIVVITTKDPEAGKLRLSLRSDLNLNLPDLNSYNLLNSRDKLELERISGFYESPTKDAAQNIALQQYYNQVLEQVARGVNTDWLAIPLQTGIEHAHHLKLEGGDRLFQYALSLQYKNQEGAMKGSGRETFNGGINLAYKHERLIFRNDLVVGYTKREESPYGSFSQYAILNPYWRPYDDNGKLVRFFTPYNRDYWTQTGLVGYVDAYPNPMYNATLNTYDKGDNTTISNNFSIEWRPLDELFFRGSVGITSAKDNSDNFKPADHSDFAGYANEDLFRKGSYAYSSGTNFNYAANFSVNYSRTLAGKHAVFAGVNVDITQNKYRNYNFLAEGFPDESIDFLGMALQYQKDGSPGGSESTIRRVGVVGNANYSFDNRYLADVSYRIDGASLYGSNRRFAPFWAAGIGWNLHYESFIKDNLKFIDRMKLRLSYGSTGSQNFAAYQSQSTYSYYTDDRYNMWMGAYQIALGNSNLEWQKRDKYNLGFELSLFNNRLMLEADIYKEKTSNLLSNLELPYSNGFTSYTENIGKLENNGFELMATAWLLRDTKRRLSWSVTGYIVHDKDKIVELSEALKAENERLSLEGGTSPNRIFREGDSQNTIYVVPSLGVDPSTGKEVFLNKDGQVTYTWNARDRIAAGNSQPKYRGNLSTMLRYKDFTLNISFGYRLGGQQYNQTLIDKVEKANKLMNVDQRVFSDRWKQPGDKTFFRGINDLSPVYASSRFVQDENTLTCQSLSLSYEIREQKWLKTIGAQYMSLTASTGELFYLSSIRRERGTDYPFTRQLLMSLSLMF